MCYGVVDTTVTVGNATAQVLIPLEHEPPGFLVLRGSMIATMWVDEELVMHNTQHYSGSYQAGLYTIRVRTVSEDEHEHTIRINSGEQVTYDYTEQREVSRVPHGR